MMEFNTSAEGVRVPLWIATLIAAIIIPIGTGLVADASVKVIVAQILLSLGALVPGVEMARNNVFSRNTVDDMLSDR